MNRSSKNIVVALPLLLGFAIGGILIFRSNRGGSEAGAGRTRPSISHSGTSQAIDLLSVVDPARDALAGSWTFEGKALHTPQVQWGRLEIPCIPPEEYELRITAARLQGSDSLNVGFVFGGRQGMLMVDGNGGENSWIDLWTPYDLTSNESMRTGKRLPWNQEATVILRVHRLGIQVSVNGTSVVEWSGIPAELKLISGYRTRHPGTLFVGCWDTVFRISRMELLPLKGSATFLQ